ncbi:MAG: GNAT family N-acetyltransferase [Eubacteriales bacterium]|nr:GNAT family N-acetyltransferase [Eubacteriales bacterium]
MITTFTLEQSDQWDRIVRSFSDYDTYWLSGYVRAFRIHGDGEPLLIFHENGETRGMNVVMRRDIAGAPGVTGRIAEGQLFDFATPYGYGGWIIEGDGTDRLFQEYGEWAAGHRIVSEFVRFHPVIHNHSACAPFYEVIPLGEVICMDLSSPDTVWANLTSKNRNVIRKAVKNDVKIYRGQYPAIYETFRRIYNETMDKDRASGYYYFGKEFYRSVLEDLPRNAQVFYAEREGEVIAASIILTANCRMNYHLSGSVRQYSPLAPTNLLLYEAALWGCENGYKTFYLGGGVGSGEDSLFKFKRAFYRGDLNRFHIGKKIFNREAYEDLLGMVKPENENFFPKYRG